MKEFDPMKTAVLSFIAVILTFMLLFAVFGEFSETVYADTMKTAQTFVGQPVSAVVSNYGVPDGRQYTAEEGTQAGNDSYWYYGNVIFQIHYDGSVSPEGIVTDVEVLR